VAGTILNIITVLIGSGIGIFVGNRLTENIQQSVVMGLGFVTLVVGVENALKTGNIIIPLLSIVIGVIIGELLQIDKALENFGAWLQRRFGVSQANAVDDDTAADNRRRFITGFVTASLVFCVGPLTFVGSIQDGMGLESGFQFLAIKSVLDLFAAMAFASSFGIGVAFTAITILIIQGGLALFGSLLVTFMSEPTMTEALGNSPMINEMTAVGGLMLIGLSLILLNIQTPRVANYLPALVIAPLMVGVGQLLGIPIYPL